MISSFSYWIESVKIDILAQYFLKFCGKSFDHKIVKFGSGEEPKLINVFKVPICKILDFMIKYYRNLRKNVLKKLKST